MITRRILLAVILCSLCSLYILDFFFSSNLQLTQSSVPQLDLCSNTASKVLHATAEDVRLTKNIPEDQELVTPDDLRMHVNRASLHSRKTNILILSSLGRSGSSFLGELVSSLFENSIYFFEPSRMLINTEPAQRNVNLNETIRYFYCSVRGDLYSRTLGDHTVRLNASPPQCDIGLRPKDEQSAQLLCRRRKVLIIKTIRLRLGWIMSLMKDDQLSLKVIHLVRDPRAVILSFSQAGFPEHNIDSACPFLLEDLGNKTLMESLYPNRYFLLRYEDLCINLPEKTLEIAKFLGAVNLNKQDQQDSGGNRSSGVPPEDLLPQCTLQFLKDHTGKLKGSKYSTYRDSRKTYQAWRTRITENQLKQTEDKCKDVLRSLGYNTFTSVSTVRNLTVPLLVDGS